MEDVNMEISWRCLPDISESDHDEFYVLVNDKGDFFCDFEDNGGISTSDYDNDKVWFESNDERLRFMLMQYEERLKGFRVVKVVKTTKTHVSFLEEN
jgi:hypothetical protein